MMMASPQREAILISGSEAKHFYCTVSVMLAPVVIFAFVALAAVTVNT